MRSQLGRREEVARRLLKEGAELSNAFKELVVTFDRASPQGEDIDVFPARQLDDLPHLFVDFGSLGDENGNNARLVLSEEAVDVEQERADPLQ